jgi:hypothetical protein
MRSAEPAQAANPEHLAPLTRPECVKRLDVVHGASIHDDEASSVDSA